MGYWMKMKDEDRRWRQKTTVDNRKIAAEPGFILILYPLSSILYPLYLLPMPGPLQPPTVERSSGLLAGLLATVALACPIQRPALPMEYLDFRAELEAAVTDTVALALRGQPSKQERLRERLTELAAYVRVDSLVATLFEDPELISLSGAIERTVRRALEAEGTGGNVRDAYRNRHGQRVAVDAVVLGLGKALRRLRTQP